MKIEYRELDRVEKYARLLLIKKYYDELKEIVVPKPTSEENHYITQNYMDEIERRMTELIDEIVGLRVELLLQ